MSAKSSDAIRERLARLQEAVPASGREAQPSPDASDGWIVAATARDGWRVEACRDFVAAQGIVARLESTGGHALLVKQADFHAATVALAVPPKTPSAATAGEEWPCHHGNLLCHRGRPRDRSYGDHRPSTWWRDWHCSVSGSLDAAAESVLFRLPRQTIAAVL
jgi:hypothetical protein